MNKKRNIYILLPVVLIVWGIIGYKIYQSIKPKTQPVVKQNYEYKYQPITSNDDFTYSLHTNYRDPFLGTLPKKKTTKKRQVSKPSKKKSVKKKPFPRITYKGLVNPKVVSKESVFMIEINGKSELLKIGQSFSNITLLSGHKKEISIRFQDSIKKIVLKP